MENGEGPAQKTLALFTTVSRPRKHAFLLAVSEKCANNYLIAKSTSFCGGICDVSWLLPRVCRRGLFSYVSTRGAALLFKESAVTLTGHRAVFTPVFVSYQDALPQILMEPSFPVLGSR